MKKNILIPAAILIVILLFVGFYFWKSNSSPVENGKVGIAGTKEQKETGLTQKASLKTLMGMKNQECTFTDKETGSSGTMKVGNGRMRGDFVSMTDKQTMHTHMISDNKDVYVWMDELQSAMKISLSSMEEINSKALANAPKTVDLNRQVDYSCKSSTPKDSDFQVPTDRTFTDMSAMMKDATKMMNEIKQNTTPATSSEGEKADACAACDQVPEPYKAQCKTSLNCK